MLVLSRRVDLGDGHAGESSARGERRESGEELDDCCSFGGDVGVFPSRGVFVQRGSDCAGRVETPGRRGERSRESVRDFVPGVVVYVLEFSVSEVFANARPGESGRNNQLHDVNVEHWIESVVHTHFGFWFERRANRDDDFEVVKSVVSGDVQRVEELSVRNERR